MENRLNKYWRKANQWFYRTADRALDEAYKAALKIKAIEDEHFGGEKIEVSPISTNNQVATYFQNDLNKYLRITRIRLAEFQTSRTVTGNNYPQPPESQQFDSLGFSDINSYTQDIEYEARILEKLSFIDDLLTRYADNTTEIDPNLQRSTFGQRAVNFIAPPTPPNSLSIVDTANQNPSQTVNVNPITASSLGRRPSKRMPKQLDLEGENVNNDKKAIIDISLINTFRRIQQDLDPNADVRVLENYRFNQGKTRTSLRFILMLILVPLLAQYISKIIIVGPVIDAYRNYHQADIFLNVNLEREALEEMEMFERNIKFKHMVGLTPKLTAEEMEEKVTEKAAKIKVDYYRKSADAIKNWFADILSIVTFIWLISNSQRQIQILKAFLGDLIAGLSDSAKAFIIILLTDTFVGFHSPHGWEIILQGTARHLGIAENNEFNSLFIATVPVLMDTVFKYWIFRYLTGQSPSSVATYKSMNE
ncbi:MULTISPECIES: proton extrusion protein PcxA [unclassified Chamaesiphon]|uniref:proton extrusion protein PcxA n=1 Tax=unclassified Chamaesiphon TaxID=2620921 RepID=UPI00286D6235|nr:MULTISPECIES: proton extrusion protein PcxA [unclassified Chamaesiphon]